MRRCTLVALMTLGSCLLDLASARAGDIDAELAVDFMWAESSNPGPNAGLPEDISAQDMGMRLRLAANQERFSAGIDYRGREAIAGDVQNSSLRMLYAAYLGYQVVPDKLDLKVGRFLAPSVVLLPVDALSATLQLDGWTASVFGGRRAILTSRRNVPLDNYLPAAGASLSWRNHWLQAEGVVAYSGDEAILLKATEEVKERFDAWNGYLHASARPHEQVTITGRVALAQRASYVIGPSWNTVDLQLRKMDLWSGDLFMEWRPRRDLRLRYDLHAQRASVYRSGRVEGTGNQPKFTRDPIHDPRFTDHRVRVSWRALDRGWLRSEVRVRLRPERQENRYGVSLDLDDIGLARLELRGRFFYDQIEPKPGFERSLDADRMYYSASLGYEVSGLDLELGASRLERIRSPYSGRTFTWAQREQPTSPNDLSLFTLETQTVGFARLFYVRGLHFAGMEVELNLEDTREVRLFFQIGTRWEQHW